MPGTYSIISRSSGSLLTAAIYMEDHQAHLTFNTPGGCDDYSTNVAQMQSTVDPGEQGSESLPTDLAGELQRIRKILVEITGKTYWYESPVASLTQEFSDLLFRIKGSSDTTKKVAFEADGLTTATTRTVTVPDRDLTIGPTLATEQSGSSGTSKDFTGIPAGTKRITIMLIGVSTNGTSPLIARIGDAGGPETSGYDSIVAEVTTAGNAIGTRSDGFVLTNLLTAAAFYSGKIVLDLEEGTANRWVASSVIGNVGSGIVYTQIGWGATSAMLDRVRLTTVNGTDTFDGGTINITYE